MQRRSFIKQAGAGVLAISTTPVFAQLLGEPLLRETKPRAPHVPEYVRNGLEHLFDMVKHPEPLGIWKSTSYPAPDLCYECVEKIPMQWNHVTTFDFPGFSQFRKQGEFSLLAREGPQTAYAFSDVVTSLGPVHVDFLWRWDYDLWKTGKPVIEALGTLAFVSIGGRLVGKMRGWLLGNILHLRSPYGLQAGTTIIDFDSSQYEPAQMPDGYFKIWKKPDHIWPYTGKRSSAYVAF